MSAVVEFGFNASKVFSGVDRLEKKLSGFQQKVLGIGGALLGVNLGFGLAHTALETVVNLDRLQRGMQTLEGSAEGGARRLEELREAARLPGLDFEQAVQGDIRLRSVGLSAKLSKQALIEMGNAISNAGGSAEQLDNVTLALTQIVSRGKVTADNVNQIANAVPQLRAVMKDVFGTADSEALQKMGIDATVFVEHLIEGFGKIKRATAGLDEDITDTYSSLKDVTASVAGPIVRELVPALRDAATWAATNKEGFAEFGREAVAGIRAVVDSVVLLNDARRALSEDSDVVLQSGTNSDGDYFEITRKATFLEKMKGFHDERQKLADAEKQTAADEAAASKSGAAGGGGTASSFVAGPDEEHVKKVADAQARLDDQKHKAALDQMELAERIAALGEDVTKAAADEWALRNATNADALKLIAAESKRVTLQGELLNLQKQSATEKEREAEAAKRSAEEARREAEAAARKNSDRRSSVLDTAMEYRMLQAKASGNERAIEQADYQQRVLERANRLEEQNGMERKDALALAIKMADLEDRANGKSTKIHGVRDNSDPNERNGLAPAWQSGPSGNGKSRTMDGLAGDPLSRNGGLNGFWDLQSGKIGGRTEPSMLYNTQPYDTKTGLQDNHADNAAKDSAGSSGNGAVDAFIEKLISRLPPALADAILAKS